VLLARALLVFTLEFEAEPTLSVPIHVDRLRVLGEEPTRVRDLSRMSGCSKEGMAMIAGFLARAGLATVEADQDTRGKVVRLTPPGLAARDRGVARLARIDDGWRAGLRAALDPVVDAPGLAANLTPRPGGWRGRPPYLAQTERVLADPRAAFPHHPLVLHRGGFSDGA
jgi:DNA-binding MarR family transcriptional regulator